jgi:hypothetical protein
MKTPFVVPQSSVFQVTALQSLSRWTVVMTGAVVSLVFGAGMTLAAPLVITAIPTTPTTLQGTSGGSKNTDCGFVGTKPSESIQVSDSFVDASGYLKFEVRSAGDPTLLVEGPTGRFCVLGDRVAGRTPQIAGRWLPGLYRIYVGDRNGQQNPYTLSVTTKAN